MKPAKYMAMTAISIFGFSNIALASCNLHGEYLVSDSGKKYPILSIRDCFGLDIKEEMRHFPKRCLAYKQAEKLAQKNKNAAIMGKSIVEVMYKGKRIYLIREETAFASPSLGWAIKLKLSKDDKEAMTVCKLPYEKCEYSFDAGSSILTADLPPKFEQKVEKNGSNREEIIQKFYGKITTEPLVEKKCETSK